MHHLHPGIVPAFHHGMKPSKGYHRLRLHRHSMRSNAYILTTNTSKRRKLFNHPEAAKIVADSISHFHDRDYVHNFAWVVMPDHVHWLVQLRSRIWMPGFHDRTVRPHDTVDELLDYILLNPVRAGIVEHPKDYPWLYAESELLEVYGKGPGPLK